MPDTRTHRPHFPRLRLERRTGSQPYHISRLTPRPGMRMLRRFSRITLGGSTQAGYRVGERQLGRRSGKVRRGAASGFGRVRGRRGRRACGRGAANAAGSVRRKGEGNAKNGNKYLAWAFVEAANFAVRSCPEAKRFYLSMSVRSARPTRLWRPRRWRTNSRAPAVYHMLREHKPFDVSRCFA